MSESKLMNLIARVTHGVVGLDLYLQGKNKYLDKYLPNFLSLKDEEINDTFMEYNQSARDVVLSSIKEVKTSITSKMDKAQTLKLIKELEDILRILYAQSFHTIILSHKNGGQK